MEKTAFIICEYNPFHNGHLKHLRETRNAGAENVICIMSGNYVQRGDIAFCDKITRAGFAVDHGADLVLELPLKYVLSGASWFAKGAIDIIRQTGMAGTVSFGASAAKESLQRIAQMMLRQEILQEIRSYSLQHGVHYAVAAERIMGSRMDISGEILKDPNNILAVEYMKAASLCGNKIDFYAVERRVVLHDSDAYDTGIAGAKRIRELVYSGCPDEMKGFLPPDVYNSLQQGMEKGLLPADRQKFAVAAMARLITETEESLREINGVRQGLENRILDSMRDCSDLQTLYDRIKTKRFTHARIRQILISAMLGIKKTTLERQNPYIRVLGMNSRGRQMIKEIRGNADVPVIMNLSEAPLCEERALDALGGKLFDLCRPSPLHISPEYSAKPYVSS